MASLPHCSLARIPHLFIIVATFLSCVASASAQTVVGPNDISYRENISASSDSFYRDSFFGSGRFSFSSGPSWLLNAMPGSRVSPLRSPPSYDRDGDRAQSIYRYANDVGTLASPFNVMLFNNVSFVYGTGDAPKARTVLPLAPDNTPYYFAGGGDANWGTNGSWGPNPVGVGTTGYPNGPGDSALNFQEVNGHVIQDVAIGVTVGVIDNLPTTAGNSGQAVSWTITTDNPIILDSGSGANAQINNSQAVGTSSLTINTTTANGLQLKSNLAVTNANPNGLLTISAPISDVLNTGSHSVTVAGPGTTIFSGANTYSGGTTVTSGTLLVNNTTGSGTGSGTVMVSNAGTLGGEGFIVGGDVTVNGTLTAGTSSAVGHLTLNAPNLNFGSGSTFHVDLGGTTADLLTLTGGIGGGNFNITNGATIAFNTLSTLTAGSYTLATYDAWNNVQFLAPTLPSGYDLVYGDTALILVAVPEPSTWIGGALALGAIVFVSRRRLLARRA